MTVRYLQHYHRDIILLGSFSRTPPYNPRRGNIPRIFVEAHNQNLKTTKITGLVYVHIQFGKFGYTPQ